MAGKATESHPLIQPHHQDCSRGMDGNLQVPQNDGANNWPAERLGASCPLDFHVDHEHDQLCH